MKIVTPTPAHMVLTPRFVSRRLLGPALITFCGLPGISFADDAATDSGGSTVSRLLHEKFLLSVGASRLRGEASVGASVNGLPPAEISLNDLGLDDDDSSYFSDLTYQLNQRWSLQAAIYSFSASSGGRATRDFNFGGEDFTVGTELDLGLDVDAYLLHASYAVYDHGAVDLRIGGGIHALDLGTSIRGEVSVGDEAISGRRSSSSLLAPVPNLRAEARWFLSDRTALIATLGWLSANVDDYEGDFVYTHLEAVYSFTERIGVSLGYQRTDVDVTESRDRSKISYDVLLDGVTLTLKYAF